MTNEIQELKIKIRSLYEQIMYYRETERQGPLAQLESEYYALKQKKENLERIEWLKTVDIKDLL